MGNSLPDSHSILEDVASKADTTDYHKGISVRHSICLFKESQFSQLRDYMPFVEPITDTCDEVDVSQMESQDSVKHGTQWALFAGKTSAVRASIRKQTLACGCKINSTEELEWTYGSGDYPYTLHLIYCGLPLPAGPECNETLDSETIALTRQAWQSGVRHLERVHFTMPQKRDFPSRF